MIAATFMTPTLDGRSAHNRTEGLVRTHLDPILRRWRISGPRLSVGLTRFVPDEHEAPVYQSAGVVMRTCRPCVSQMSTTSPGNLGYSVTTSSSIATSL